VHRSLLAFALSKLKQLPGIEDRLGGAIEIGELGAQPGALAPELLGALGLRPDGLILELPGDLFKTLFLAVVLKETPVGRRYVPRGL
jgi:hypothetical protein